MKKNSIILFFMLGMLHMAYGQENHRERIKAYKTAYITQQLDLSSQEAEQFWPIYNAFEKQSFNIRILEVRDERKKIKEQGGFEALTDKDAQEALHKFLQNEKEALKIKERLYKDLSPVLSPVKMLKLYKAEADFNKKLLSDYRKRNGPNR